MLFGVFKQSIVEFMNNGSLPEYDGVLRCLIINEDSWRKAVFSPDRLFAELFHHSTALAMCYVGRTDLLHIVQPCHFHYHLRPMSTRVHESGWQGANVCMIPSSQNLYLVGKVENKVPCSNAPEPVSIRDHGPACVRCDPGEARAAIAVVDSTYRRCNDWAMHTSG